MWVEQVVREIADALSDRETCQTGLLNLPETPVQMMDSSIWSVDLAGIFTGCYYRSDGPWGIYAAGCLGLLVFRLESRTDGRMEGRIFNAGVSQLPVNRLSSPEDCLISTHSVVLRRNRTARHTDP